MTDYLSMTKSELEKNGFRLWSKETGLMLIPGIRFHEIISSLPAGTELFCIDGGIYTIGKDDFDDDTRGGLTAYGWIPKN